MDYSKTNSCKGPSSHIYLLGRCCMLPAELDIAFSLQHKFCFINLHIIWYGLEITPSWWNDLTSESTEPSRCKPINVCSLSRPIPSFLLFLSRSLVSTCPSATSFQNHLGWAGLFLTTLLFSTPFSAAFQHLQIRSELGTVLLSSSAWKLETPNY